MSSALKICGPESWKDFGARAQQLPEFASVLNDKKERCRANVDLAAEWIWLQDGFGCILQPNPSWICAADPAGIWLQRAAKSQLRKKKSQLRGMGGTTTGMLDLTCTRSLQPFTARKAAS